MPSTGGLVGSSMPSLCVGTARARCRPISFRISAVCRTFSAVSRWRIERSIKMPSFPESRGKYCLTHQNHDLGAEKRQDIKWLMQFGRTPRQRNFVQSAGDWQRNSGATSTYIPSLAIDNIVYIGYI